MMSAHRQKLATRWGGNPQGSFGHVSRVTKTFGSRKQTQKRPQISLSPPRIEAEKVSVLAQLYRVWGLTVAAGGVRMAGVCGVTE